MKQRSLGFFYVQIYRNFTAFVLYYTFNISKRNGVQICSFFNLTVVIGVWVWTHKNHRIGADLDQNSDSRLEKCINLKIINSGSSLVLFPFYFQGVQNSFRHHPFVRPTFLLFPIGKVINNIENRDLLYFFLWFVHPGVSNFIFSFDFREHISSSKRAINSTVQLSRPSQWQFGITMIYMF